MQVLNVGKLAMDEDRIAGAELVEGQSVATNGWQRYRNDVAYRKYITQLRERNKSNES